MSQGKIMTKTPIFQSFDSPIQVKPDLEDFWKLESVGIRDKEVDMSDEIALKSFKKYKV